MKTGPCLRSGIERQCWDGLSLPNPLPVSQTCQAASVSAARDVPTRDRMLLARTKLFVAHLRIARLDHWSKNVFVLPGIAVAVSIDPALLEHLAVLPIVVGLIGIGLVASSIYALNKLFAPLLDKSIRCA